MTKEFTYIEEFINRIDVVCPECSSKAAVISNPENRKETRLTCIKCGLSKNWIGNSSVVYTSTNWSNSEGILLGKPVDCYFKIPLWYKTDFRGEILFAYNIDHLSFIEKYICNKLRQRKTDENGWSNKSLESRLPKWMLSAKNRLAIEKKIIDLKNKG